MEGVALTPFFFINDTYSNFRTILWVFIVLTLKYHLHLVNEVNRLLAQFLDHVHCLIRSFIE
jgi:hypothetical protein